jgi:hypothetical protein
MKLIGLSFWYLFIQIQSCLRRIFLIKYFRHQDTKTQSLINNKHLLFVSWCLCGYSFRFIRRVRFLAVQTVFEGYRSNSQDKLHKNQLKHGVEIPMAHASGDPQTHSITEIMRNYRSGGAPLDGHYRSGRKGCIQRLSYRCQSGGIINKNVFSAIDRLLN